MADTLTLIGNVASDPAVTTTRGGHRMLSFRLATNHGYRDRTGTWINGGTNWYNVTAFRSLAENASESLAKGDSVIVTGSLRIRDWEANGREGTAVDLDAHTIGHDLRWGSTGAFTRKRSGVANGHPDASSSDVAPNGSESHGSEPHGWAAPGTAPHPAESVDTGDGVESPGDEWALAGVGATAPAADVETPF